jgi:hypothetical protein
VSNVLSEMGADMTVDDWLATPEAMAVVAERQHGASVAHVAAMPPEHDDPTIRRCIGFAKSWDCAGIRVVNLYALRSTDPKALWRSPDPVGPDNDGWLRMCAYDAAEEGWPLVATWGTNARPARVTQVLRLPRMGNLQALGTTKNGYPRHPLYLRSDAALSPWPAR